MREGSLEAPERHPLDWRSSEFYDSQAIEAELARVFEVCHGCRRCFNLCESFPRLFDLIDATPGGEAGEVDPANFASVVEACTLCDMCFMTKCPYVPPHEFNIDFPHLMLRARAAQTRRRGPPFVQNQLAQTDRNGRLARLAPGLVNWAARVENRRLRWLMEKVLGIARRAELPRFARRSFMRLQKETPAAAVPPAAAKHAKPEARRAALFVTCPVNDLKPEIAQAAQAVLARQGIETRNVYPGCCAMPMLEQGALDKTAAAAKKIAAELRPLIDQGYDIITLTASCGLMFKFEYPLLLPEDESVKTLAARTFDICQYLTDHARAGGLAPGLAPVPGKIAVHLACHARAQIMGPRAAELLGLVPQASLVRIERCSGHGGTFGVLRGTAELAAKVGRPPARTLAAAQAAYLVSDCPLAAKHLVQLAGSGQAGKPDGPKLQAAHPVQLIAQAYGLPSGLAPA